MTSSATNSLDRGQVRRQAFLALFTALAITVHTLEVLLPSPVPWFRLGLANVLTVVVLFLYDSRAAWSLTLMRIGLGALLLGRLFSPGFWLSLAGGIMATLLMSLARKHCGALFSPVGISVIGATGHAAGQFLVAWVIVIQHQAIWKIFPLFMFTSLAAGLLTGWMAAVLLNYLMAHPVFSSKTNG